MSELVKVDLTGAAAVIGVSYDFLQKNWRRMHREEGFPWPYTGGHKHGRPLWVLALLELWMTRTSGPGAAPVAEPAPRAQAAPPANDPAPLPMTDRVAALLRAAGA